MNHRSRLARLEKIYALYDALCAGTARFCTKGCAACCTVNVTVTSLEAALILAHWNARGRTAPPAQVDAALRQPRFRPTVTINHLAELCAKDLDGPDEAAEPGAGPCPLLARNLCSIYPVRPFGCRAMLSQSDCTLTGAADMPEWLLSANTLFMQYIEALDAQGVSGNLVDVLVFLGGHRSAYETGAMSAPEEGLPGNRAIPVLMIPPRYRRRLQEPARALQQLLSDGHTGRGPLS